MRVVKHGPYCRKTRLHSGSQGARTVIVGAPVLQSARNPRATDHRRTPPAGSSVRLSDWEEARPIHPHGIHRTEASQSYCYRGRALPYENGEVTWLLTGGAGYIGGHVARCLKRAGHPVIILDDLSTGDESRVVGFPLVTASILADPRRLTETMVEHGVRGIVHLAAKKAVGESVQRPLFYYEQNVQGSLALLRGSGCRGAACPVLL